MLPVLAPHIGGSSNPPAPASVGVAGAIGVYHHTGLKILVLRDFKLNPHKPYQTNPLGILHTVYWYFILSHSETLHLFDYCSHCSLFIYSTCIQSFVFKHAWGLKELRRRLKSEHSYAHLFLTV